MSITTKLRYWLARRIIGVKAADLSFIPSWTRQSWLDVSFERLTSEGYKANAAVHICVTTLALACQQPRPVVQQQDGEPDARHPLQALLNRPNPDMSWNELAILCTVYKAIGGSVFLKKVQSRAGRTVELWPYHIGQVRPVPGRYDWVAGYEHYDEGQWRPVEKEAIIHLKWPSVDPAQPWLPVAPLIAVAREVDSDTEATRYQYALLANDATARVAIRVPEGNRPMLQAEREAMIAAWYARHGGAARGGVTLLERGASIERLSLNMEELAFDALRKVPEARISSAFRIPPEYSGLTVGQEHSTYNNKSEARAGFYEDTVVPMLDLDAGELTQQLAGEYGDQVRVAFDYSKVVALQDNEDARWTRVIAGWDKGLVGQREARRLLGLPEELPANDTFKTSAQPALAFGDVIDAEPVRRALPGETRTDDNEGAPVPDETQKAARLKRRATKALTVEQLERQMQRAVATYLEGQYTRAADAIARA